MMAYESPLGNIVTTMTVNEPVPLVTLPPLMSPLAKKQRGEALASDLVSVPSSGSERLWLLPKLAAGLYGSTTLPLGRAKIRASPGAP